MVGKPWFSGFQNTFTFFCAMLFDRVMAKNVILKTSKIAKKRHFMAKNHFKILDILKIHIYNYFYILEAYNCQKEFRKNEKHGF